MKKLGRIARLGGLTSRVGGSYLGQKVKGAFQDAQSRRDGMDDTHRENARRVAQTMGKLKGAAMKVGQNLAQVVEGMDVVDRIKSVPTGNRGRYQDVPREDVVIRTAIPRALSGEWVPPAAPSAEHGAPSVPAAAIAAAAQAQRRRAAARAPPRAKRPRPA